MGERRFIIIMLLLFINFLGTIFIVFSKHSTAFYAHLLLSLFFLMVGIVLLSGIYHDSPWAYQIGMLLFAALLIDLALLYQGRGRVGTFFVVGSLDLIGFLICIGSLESFGERKSRLNTKPQTDPKVEVYKAEQQAKQEPMVETYQVTTKPTEKSKKPKKRH